MRLRFQDWLPEWKFIIVGDGPLRQELEIEANALRNVEFAGYIDNPGEYYKKARIILLTSKYEGYPMALIEAQRFGTVPVTYNISAGVRAIVENGGGVIVSGNTPKRLAKTVYNLTCDNALMKRMSMSAYYKSEENRIENVAGEWEKMLTTNPV